MPHLQRLPNPPKLSALSEADRRYIEAHFDINQTEVNFDGQYMDLHKIDEIEVAKAARQSGPAGWLVKNIVYGGEDRYHLALYSGRNELVLPNITLPVARYVVQSIAYHARAPIRYTGPDDIAPVSDS